MPTKRSRRLGRNKKILKTKCVKPSNKTMEGNSHADKLETTSALIDKIQTEINHLEIEWLLICSAVRTAENTPAPVLPNSPKLSFKDADDINAIPLDLAPQAVKLNDVNTSDDDD